MSLLQSAYERSYQKKFGSFHLSFFFLFYFNRKFTDSLKLEVEGKTTELLKLNVKVDEFERKNAEIVQENILLKGKEEDHIKQVCNYHIKN